MFIYCSHLLQTWHKSRRSADAPFQTRLFEHPLGEKHWLQCSRPVDPVQQSSGWTTIRKSMPSCASFPKWQAFSDKNISSTKAQWHCLREDSKLSTALHISHNQVLCYFRCGSTRDEAISVQKLHAPLDQMNGWCRCWHMVVPRWEAIDIRRSHEMRCVSQLALLPMLCEGEVLLRAAPETKEAVTMLSGQNPEGCWSCSFPAHEF